MNSFMSMRCKASKKTLSCIAPMCCAEESRSKRIDLDYESNTWLQGYRWTCQVAWYPRRFVSKTMDPYKKVIFKICKFPRKSLSFGYFLLFFRQQTVSGNFQKWMAQSNRRIVGSQVQLFRANFYTSPWR